ncbi:MAG: Ferric uptake regulation protein [Verrucomicrobia bacterium ADurb.Bin474]|nr:MAG: Ferric uptake regulation protein [Verrucomicrobia bacterium ADurb.Bin474]
MRSNLNLMTEDKNVEASIDIEGSDSWSTFKSFLGANNLRVTNQRQAIFRAAYYSDDHFTAEDLLTKARLIDRSVSRATVYRTLPILTESGLIKEVDIGKDYLFYVSHRNATTFKAQVICKDTDRIIEVDAPFMEWYGKAVAARLGMKVVSMRLQIEARPSEGVEVPEVPSASKFVG